MPLGSAVTDVGEVAVKAIDHQQISQGAKSWASLVQRKTQEWNAIVSDPNTDFNDPTIGQKFGCCRWKPTKTRPRENRAI